MEANKRKGSNCSLECETLTRIGHGGGWRVKKLIGSENILETD